MSFAAQLIDGSRAAACSRSSCIDPVRTFGPDARVPGNLVRFAFSLQSGASVQSLSLQADDGVEIPLQERVVQGAHLLEPEVAIDPDTAVVLRYSYECFGQRTDREYRFTTSEAIELTITQAMLTLVREGTSSTGGDTAFKRYQYKLPVPEQAKHLLDHEVTLDGEPLGDTELEDPLGDGTVTVDVSCDGTLSSDSCGNVYLATPGLHELRVATNVIGEEAQPDPIAIGVRVGCDDALCNVSRVKPARVGRGLVGAIGLTALLVLRRRRRARAFERGGAYPA